MITLNQRTFLIDMLTDFLRRDGEVGDVFVVQYDTMWNAFETVPLEDYKKILHLIYAQKREELVQILEKYNLQKYAGNNTCRSVIR